VARSDGRAALALGFGASACLAFACAHAPAPSGTPSEGPRPSSSATSGDAGVAAHRDAGDADAWLPSIFLGEATVVSHVSAFPPADRPLAVTLELTEAPGASFAELAKRGASLPSGAGSVAFSLVGYPPSHDRPLARHSRPSFVVDYDEPSVQAARAEAVRLCGPSPTPDQLALFVYGYIDHKDLLRGFDLASQVARRKEGDCTEHAVLLVALARSFGFPARVVMGMALVVVDGKVEAVGHAWAEVRQSGQWKVTDAAIPAQLGARYLPLSVLDDEGPAFARAMVEGPHPLLLIRRIVIDEAPK
jgi:transglutaminase-like putative cysteine protease